MTHLIPSPRTLAALTCAVALIACGPGANRPVGSGLDEGGFGNPTMNNVMIQNGELSFAQELGRRFVEEVPTTINFEFNSAILDQEARAILRQQAHFIQNFPEVRFTVYGHTDLVGSNAYNHRLGLRRARAVVNFFVAQGIDRSRLDALVSLGETQPIVATETQERRNRRTVTEVSGFVDDNPLVLDGQFARIIYRGYAGAGGGE